VTLEEIRKNTDEKSANTIKKLTDEAHISI
jgi:hypothetical protein